MKSVCREIKQLKNAIKNYKNLEEKSFNIIQTKKPRTITKC
jgi:hypothetical protein